MKIKYLSDLHLEFVKSNKLEKYIKNIKGNNEEICILAGDIGNPYIKNNHYDIFMNYINVNFKKTFIISGNHEYYNENKTIEETNDYLLSFFSKYDNMSFLNNSYEYYEDYCFIGTTLWSYIINPIYEINDIKNIPDFNYVKYNELNTKSIKFLEDVIENNNNCIIITHHIPSYNLMHNKYKTQNMENYNQWFYCDLDNFIEKNKNKITCWFYGHTHISSYNLLYGIPFFCNPIGYPGENIKTNFNKIHII